MKNMFQYTLLLLFFSGSFLFGREIRSWIVLDKTKFPTLNRGVNLRYIPKPIWQHRQPQRHAVLSPPLVTYIFLPLKVGTIKREEKKVNEEILHF